MKAASRRVWAFAAVVAGGGAAGLLIAARRQGTSVRGLLVGNMIVPALFGAKGRDQGDFHLAIADNRAAGPALPSAKVRRRYRFSDENRDGRRVFWLAPLNGPAGSMRVLYLHGGAYVFDLARVQWPVISGIVDRTGAVVVTPIYPLAPENTVESGLAAALAAYRDVVDEVGPANVVVVGDSAGGGLALALAQRLRDAGEPGPAALALFFPWLDVTCRGDDQPALIAREPMLSVDELRDAGRMWAGSSDPAAAPASPLFGGLADLPPTLMLTGTRDMLLSDTRRAKALSPAMRTIEYPGMFHGWICAPIPEAGRALDDAAAFLLRHMAAD